MLAQNCRDNDVVVVPAIGKGSCECRENPLLDLPEDLYEQVRQIAEQSKLPLEHVVLESIRLLFVPPPASTDVATSLAALHSYSDE
jgi:hypothetical protein